MKLMRQVAFVLCTLLLAVPALAKVKVTRSVFNYSGHPRTYYSFAPDVSGPLPLVLLLHGSGRDGAVMAEALKDLASREHFIIAAPDANNSALWDSTVDTQEFLHAVVDQVRATHAVDGNRIYLFGHSAGAVYALTLALTDSEYYAAAAVHAGALWPENYRLFDYAARKMPVAIWVGSKDQFFSVDDVNATKKSFDSHGFHLELYTLLGATHDYDNFSEELDAKAWAFLKTKQLNQPDPARQQ